jgi:hypothetical protein
MNPIPVHGSGAQAGIEPALTAYRQPEGRLHESGTSSAHLCTRSSDVTLASSGPVLRRLKHRALDTRRVSIADLPRVIPESTRPVVDDDRMGHHATRPGQRHPHGGLIRVRSSCGMGHTSEGIEETFRIWVGPLRVNRRLPQSRNRQDLRNANGISRPWREAPLSGPPPAARDGWSEAPLERPARRRGPGTHQATVRPRPPRRQVGRRTVEQTRWLSLSSLPGPGPPPPPIRPRPGVDRRWLMSKQSLKPDAQFEADGLWGSPWRPR